MATITSAGTGNSNATATWVGGVVPDADDDVVIDSGHTVTQNANATFNSLALNGTFVASSSYSLTIDGENSSGQAFIANSGTFTHGNGTVTITTPAATNIYFKTENPLNNLIINHSSAVVNLAGNPDDLKCEGDLTITAGTLQSTNSGATLEVDGDASVTGTLNWSGTSGGAVELGSLTINSGGTYSATSGTTTITKTSATAGHSGQPSAIEVKSGGTFTNNDGTVLLSSSLDQDLEFDGTGNMHHLTINKSDNDVIHNSNLTIEGDLSITLATAHTFRPNTGSRTLTVTGNVTIVEGKVGDTTNYTGAISFGSLTIESGGTYIATSGTTTITSETSGGVAVANSGTFTHNSGTVSIETPASTFTSPISYNNLEINHASAVVKFTGTSGSTMTIGGNLTIKQGAFEADDGDENLTVTGDVTVGDGTGSANTAVLGHADDTSAMTFGSLTIASDGKYNATSGTTTITSDDDGPEGRCFYVHTNGTFTHNKGTIDCTSPSNPEVEVVGQSVTKNPFYNIKSTASHIGWKSTTNTILNNCTIAGCAFNSTDGYVNCLGILENTANTYNTSGSTNSNHFAEHFLLSGGTVDLSNINITVGSIRNTGGTIS